MTMELEGIVAFPDEAVARFRSAGLWEDSTIALQFSRIAAKVPGNIAVATPEGRLTYSELDDRANRIAAGLLRLGLRPGERIMLQVGNQLSTVVAWYAILKAGLVPVCTIMAHRSHEIAEIGRITEATAHLVAPSTGGFDFVGFAREMKDECPTLREVVLVEGEAEEGTVSLDALSSSVSADEAARVVAEVQARISLDDVAVFQLSGGTTGLPKVIPRLQAEYWYNSVAYAARLGWDETVVVAHLGPVIHNAGVICAIFPTHSVGGCLVLGGPKGGLKPTDLVTSFEVTDVIIGRGLYNWIHEERFSEAAAILKRVILSGGKVPVQTFERLKELKLWSGQLFGMGEGLCTVTELDASEEVRATTVGNALSPFDEMRILIPGTEELVPDGVIGELACRGPYTIRGYFKADEHNARSFTSDGFYRTGDLATLESHGGPPILRIEGRIKDLINRGGEKINCEEVEVQLMMHPFVLAAAVVAMPDARLGEKACAYVVTTNDELTLGDVGRHLESLGVARYKWPEKLILVGELPLTNIDKLDKKALREDVQGRLLAEGVE